MAYSNSPLATSQINATHFSSRAGDIRKITIHHAACVGVSGRDIARSFTGTREASANYCIGVDGDICLSVPEKYRAWTSSSRSNDNVAVTIEVANVSGQPEWAISRESWNALIALCVDICQRNGIAELRYTGDETGTLTEHQMFTATECPGKYLHEHMSEICNTINKRLYKNPEKRYNEFLELPEWCKATVQKLLDKDLLRGTSDGLDLSEDMLRILVILDRGGIFDV